MGFVPFTRAIYFSKRTPVLPTPFKQAIHHLFFGSPPWKGEVELNLPTVHSPSKGSISFVNTLFFGRLERETNRNHPFSGVPYFETDPKLFVSSVTVSRPTPTRALLAVSQPLSRLSCLSSPHLSHGFSFNPVDMLRKTQIQALTSLDASIVVSC